MTFEEWWDDIHCDLLTERQIAEQAWEAGIQEGVLRMYRLYNICPECKVAGGQHKMDCSRG